VDILVYQAEPFRTSCQLTRLS